MINRNKNTLLLHLIVFIWGFTGILGALITVPSEKLVWYRMMIALTVIFIYIIGTKISLQINRLTLAKFLGTGIIISLHWIFFFEAIKVSNISVTLACLSSATLFTAILEPLIKKQKIVFYEIILGIAVITGLLIIFKFETRYQAGIFYTLFSSCMASLFTVLNGQYAKKHNPSQIAFYEMAGGFGAISIYLLLTSAMGLAVFNIATQDVIYLMLLGTICTAFALIASILVMKELSPFTVTMTTNLEPVYGIIMAYLFFDQKEKMSVEFYLGTIIILASIFINGYFKQKSLKTIQNLT
jgi:drug/metabolite transporter (DMT)-like permease